MNPGIAKPGPVHSPLAGREGPLRGIKVLEFAGLGPAPFGCMMLAELGADVVEVVRPGTPPPDPADFYLRGRRRIALDLKQKAGAQAAADLAGRCDVLVEGFRPGVMEGLGLGPDDLSGRAPGLIYARMTGWGQEGPLAHEAGHDINYISIAGALHYMRASNGEPVAPLNLVGDQGGGALYLVSGVLAALFERTRTGQGQTLDVAIYDCVTHMLTPFFALRAKGAWHDAAGINVLDGGAHFYRTYRCADDRYLAVGPLEPIFYRNFLLGLGLDPADFPPREDPANWSASRDLIATRLATRTRDEWCEIFAGAEACVTPVLTFEEAKRHPHAHARGTFAGAGAPGAPRPAPRFSGLGGAGLPSAPPRLFDPQEIANAWRQAGETSGQGAALGLSPLVNGGHAAP